MNLKQVNKKYVPKKKKSADFNLRQDNFNKNELEPIMSTGNSVTATPSSKRKVMRSTRLSDKGTGFKSERQTDNFDKQLIRKALARQEQIIEELQGK